MRFNPFNKNESFKDSPHEEFWLGFKEHLEQSGRSLRVFGSLTKSNINYDLVGETSFCGCEFGVIGFDEGVGRTFKRHIWLVAAITPCKGWLSAKVRFSEYVPIELFDMLTKDIEQIKSCFDTPNQVDWDKPGPGPKRVGFFRAKIDFDDKSSWEELFEWLCVNLEKLEQVFMNFLALYFYDTVK